MTNSVADRRREGKALRTRVPLESHGADLATTPTTGMKAQVYND